MELALYVRLNVDDAFDIPFALYQDTSKADPEYAVNRRANIIHYAIKMLESTSVRVSTISIVGAEE